MTATDDGAHVFARTLTWRDGFAIALVVPVAIFVTIGPAIAGIGSGAVATLFAIACVFGLVQNFLYAELALMFPDKPGGITLYAHEAFRGYFAPLGCIVTFGYWAGWNFGNAVFALTAGTLIQAQFFPDVTWGISTGLAEIELAHIIGLVALIGIWTLNTLGIELTILLNKVLGVLAIGLILLLGVVPLLTGNFSTDGVTWGLTGDALDWSDLRVAMVFLFIFGWTAYGTEACATFSPEYRNPRRDTPKALVTAGLFTMFVAVLLPIGLGGIVGDTAIAEDPGGVYVNAFAAVVGQAGGLVTILIVASILLVMNTVTANAGRALYGIAQDGMTVRQLDHLNARGVPSRAMLFGLVLNVIVLLFVGNVLAIIFTSNIGYILATAMTLLAYALLRRDRPGWPRPIRLPGFMVPVAVVLALVNAALLVVGFLNPQDAGYGGVLEQVIGVGVLVGSLLLFAYRRVVQDRGSPTMREETAPPPELMSGTEYRGSSEPGEPRPAPSPE